MFPMDDLHSILHFTDADLALNRQGQLSPNQIEYLHKFVRRQEPGCLVATFFFMGFAILIVGKLSNSWATGVAAALILFVVMAVLMIYMVSRSARALATGEVKLTSGRASRRTHTGHGKAAMTTFYLKIGDLEFSVNPEVYRAFQDGVAYKVYFVMLLANTIVSAEVIR